MPEQVSVACGFGYHEGSPNPHACNGCIQINGHVWLCNCPCHNTEVTQ